MVNTTWVALPGVMRRRAQRTTTPWTRPRSWFARVARKTRREGMRPRTLESALRRQTLGTCAILPALHQGERLALARLSPRSLRLAAATRVSSLPPTGCLGRMRYSLPPRYHGRWPVILRWRRLCLLALLRWALAWRRCRNGSAHHRCRHFRRCSDPRHHRVAPPLSVGSYRHHHPVLRLSARPCRHRHAVSRLSVRPCRRRHRRCSTTVKAAAI